MNKAFVQHAQDNVHSHQRSEDQQRLVGKRRLKGLSSALESRLNSRGQTQFPLGRFYFLYRVPERYAGSEIERNRYSWKLALVVYGQSRRRSLKVSKSTERHLAPARRSHIDVFQRVGILPILRGYFHHDVVLIQLLVHRRDRSLSKRVVQGFVYHLSGYSKPGRRVAIDCNGSHQPAVLLIYVYVGELRHASKSLEHLRRPPGQIIKVVALQRELKVGVSNPAADVHVLNRAQKRARADFSGELSAQPVDHLIRADLPF